MLLVVPISYCALKIFPKPEYIFIAQIIICILAQIIRLIIIKPMINFSLIHYFKEVIYTCTKVTIISSILPVIVYCTLQDSIYSFFLVCALSLFSTTITIYLIGLNNNEKSFVQNRIKKLINRE